jgi:hypothetical protein
MNPQREVLVRVPQGRGCVARELDGVMYAALV